MPTELSYGESSPRLPSFGRLFCLSLVLWAAQCAAATEVRIGQVIGLSGLDAVPNRTYLIGLKMAFDAANAAAKSKDVTFRLVTEDDGGAPDRTVAATRKLLMDPNVLLLVGYAGGRNIGALVDSQLLEEHRVALVGYRAPEVRPESPMLFSVSAGMAEEISKIVQHLALVGVTKVGLLHEDGPGAPNLLALVSSINLSSKAKIIERASYPAGTVEVNAAVQRFVLAPLQAVVLVSTSAAAAAFAREYRNAGGNAQIYTDSSIDAEYLMTNLHGIEAEGVVISQVVPSPYKISNRLSKDYRDAVAKLGADSSAAVGFPMMEGYITGRYIVEAVHLMGPNPKRARVASALERLGTVDLGGYDIAFSQSMHIGSHYVDLSIIGSARRVRQ